MNKVVKFNANHYVVVRLNSDGVHRYLHHLKSLYGEGKHKLSKLSESNVLKIQLWELMEIFGPHIRMWTGTGFESNEVFLLLEDPDEIGGESDKDYLNIVWCEGGGEVS